MQRPWRGQHRRCSGRARLRGQQQLLEIGRGPPFQAPPLVNGNEYRGLYASLGYDLWAFGKARFEKLAEAGLCLLHLPCSTHTSSAGPLTTICLTSIRGGSGKGQGSGLAPSPPHGVAEHHLPSVEHYDQADEAHPRKLPRQPLVRQVPLELRRPLPDRRRYAGLVHRLAALKALRALQLLEFDQIATLKVWIAGDQRLQGDVRVSFPQLRLRSEHVIIGHTQIGSQEP